MTKLEQDTTNNLQKQVINLYPITEKTYFLSLAYLGNKDNKQSFIQLIFNLIVKENQGEISFSIPLKYLTRTWERQKVGNVTYVYQKNINLKRAKQFNKKNTLIAKKLGVKAEKLTFYMCANYQEILKLCGFEYLLKGNSYFRDGYGVSDGKIFSVMNNEDFSHDMFHYYSGKIHEGKNRNWITEEGVAYSWGNAYYTNQQGEMVTQSDLVDELKSYLKQNPKTNLLTIFKNQESVLTHIAPDISTRSLLSSLICDEVERKKGMEGLLKLINCGRKDRLLSYFKMTDELVGINEANFNQKVGGLLSSYKK